MANQQFGKTEPILRNEITAKCVVNFRPSGSWQGEFGFDWLRGGDTGRPGDTWYAEIIGPTVGGTFAKDIPQYDKFAREYKQYVITWKKAKGSSNHIYCTPVMTLLKGKKAKLTLKVEVEEKAKEIKLDYDENLFQITGSIKPLNKGKHTLTDAITIECTEGFSSDQYIDVIAISDNDEETFAGRLTVKANNATNRRKATIVLVNCLTNIGSTNQSANITGRQSMLKKYFKQFYVNGDIVVRNLNLRTTEFNNLWTENGGVKYPDAACMSYLNSQFIASKTASYGVDFLNSYRIFFFGVKCKTSGKEGLYGRANGIVSKEVAVLLPGLQDTTAAHELLHAFGLRHPFDQSNLYQFESDKTDNIMDYSDMNGIPVIASWQYQWKIVHGNLPADT